MKIKVGDTITFKTATRDGCRTATRKVKDIDAQGRPLVGYAGWTHFIVHRREVTKVNGVSV